MSNTEPVRPTDVVAANARAEMARRGVRQIDVSEALGLTAPAVSHRLTGRTSIDVNELVLLAGFLGVPIAALLNGLEVAS